MKSHQLYHRLYYSICVNNYKALFQKFSESLRGKYGGHRTGSGLNEP